MNKGPIRYCVLATLSPAGGRFHYRHINFATPQRTGRQPPTLPCVRDLHFLLSGQRGCLVFSTVAPQKVGPRSKQPGGRHLRQI